jgi:hypothetical protein
MAATRLPNKSKILTFAKIELMYPAIRFLPGEVFSWSPVDHIIHYPKQAPFDSSFIYSLLHEIGHAELLHNNFTNDLSLVKIERDAWEKSKEIAQKLGTTIDDEHIEKCMDTYRDWLYARSLCPNCHQCGIQTSKTAYKCIFCDHAWRVSESRLCKVTRRSIKKNS